MTDFITFIAVGGSWLVVVLAFEIWIEYRRRSWRRKLDEHNSRIRKAEIHRYTWTSKN